MCLRLRVLQKKAYRDLDTLRSKEVMVVMVVIGSDCGGWSTKY